MRAVSPEMAAVLASRKLARARCLWLEQKDGVQLGFNDIDVPLEVDIGFGSVTYRAGRGVVGSDIEQTVGLEPGNMEISGPIDEVTRAEVWGGVFSDCRVRVFDVMWDNLDYGIIPIMGGRIADGRVEGNRFIFEMRSHADKFNSTIGRVLAPYCTHDFGDAKCTKTRQEFPATVASVAAGASQFIFTTSLGTTHPQDFFNLGTIRFDTGPNAGLDEIEIFDYHGDSEVELLAPLPRSPEVGDQIVLRRGCSKLKSSTDSAVLTCLFWENVVNFGGFDQVPGTEKYMRFTAKTS